MLSIRGQPLTHEDIAAWAGCTPQNIVHIEQRALRKLWHRLREAGLTLEELPERGSEDLSYRHMRAILRDQ